MDHKKDMLKYLRGNSVAIMLGITLLFVALGAFFLLFYYAMDLDFEEGVIAIIFAVVAFALGIIVAGLGIAGSIVNRSEIKKLESTGKLDEIALDFSRAVKMVEDQFRMGDNYIFIKSGDFIKYEDISKIYQYVHSTNNREDRRELHVDNTKGVPRTLCKLALRNKDDEKVKNICAAVLSKNPNIQIGYK